MPVLRCTNALVEMEHMLNIYILKKFTDCEANEGEKVEKKQGNFGDCLKYRIPGCPWLSMVMAFMFFLGFSLSTCCMVSRFFGKPDRRKMEET